MAKIWTENRLHDRVVITFDREMVGGVAVWEGKIEGRTMATPQGGSETTFRQVDFQKIMPQLTQAQRDQITAAMNLLTQRFATFLQVDPS